MSLFTARLDPKRANDTQLGWQAITVIAVAPTHIEKLTFAKGESGPEFFLSPAYFVIVPGEKGLYTTHIDCESLDNEIAADIYKLELV